eukprot:680985-Alexandrium_andersonii.AAC.1
MHCFDLGIIQEYLGSVLWTLVFDGSLPGNAEQRLAVVWDRIRDLYREQGTKTRLANLTLAMFCNPKSAHGSFPSLAAHAAETKALLPILVQ